MDTILNIYDQNESKSCKKYYNFYQAHIDEVTVRVTAQERKAHYSLEHRALTYVITYFLMDISIKHYISLTS